MCNATQTVCTIYTQAGFGSCRRYWINKLVMGMSPQLAPPVSDQNSQNCELFAYQKNLKRVYLYPGRQTVTHLWSAKPFRANRSWDVFCNDEGCLYLKSTVMSRGSSESVESQYGASFNGEHECKTLNRGPDWCKIRQRTKYIWSDQFLVRLGGVCNLQGERV